MSKRTTLTIQEAFELFIRKCKIKNLTELSISSYEKKMVHFYEFIDKEEPITTITSDTVDDYILWLRENTEANDITINSYLRSVRAFLYYCMECNYIPTFKIKLIKAEKKIKETYTDEELVRLLEKPDINNCSFSCYKTWVFENYLLGTGNRISTALDLHIGDINFQSGVITLRKTKNRKQQIIPYLQAKNGENAFTPFFFNWINGRSLFEEQYKQCVAEYKAKHNDKMLTEDEYDEEEQQLAKLGMTPEQAVWRRDKISISGLDAFHVEYPSTPEESFVATGASVFDNAKVVRLQQSIRY